MLRNNLRQENKIIMPDQKQKGKGDGGGKSPFITPADAIEQIATLIKTVEEAEGDEGAVILASDLKAIIDQVASGETISYRGIKAGVVQTINRASATGQVLNSSQIWVYLKRGGDRIPLSSVETALTELEAENSVHRIRDGQLSGYRIGAKPPEDGE